MKRFIKNKRGNFLDWFLVIALLFMFAICVVVALLITNTVIDSGIFADDVTANSAIQQTRTTILTFDNMMLFAIIIGILTTFVGSMISLFSNTPPGAVIVLVMGLVFIGMLLCKPFFKQYKAPAVLD